MSHLLINYIIKLLFVFLLLPTTNILPQSCQEAWDNTNPHYPDIAPPTLTSEGIFQEGYAILDVLNDDWQTSSTPLILEANKLVTLEMFNEGLYASPKEYTVLYRIDPRFSRSQVFISQVQNSVPQYDVTKLETIISNNNYSFTQKVNAMNDYFNFTNRPKIFVKSGQIVNIILSSNSFSSPYTDPSNPTILGIYTNNSINNQIIYANASTICSSNPLLNQCQDDIFKIDPTTDNTFFGIPNNSPTINSLVSSCTAVNINSLCSYQNGIGMNITFNGTPIKDSNTSFISLDNNTMVFRYRATSDGVLDFIDDSTFSTSNMFITLPSPITNYWVNESAAQSTLTEATEVNFFYFGSYLMNIEIGGEDLTSNSQSENSPNALSVSYIISNSTPSTSDMGTLISGNTARFDAPDGGGKIWFKITNNAKLAGEIQINYAGYTQASPVADFLLDNLVMPLSTTFKTLSQELFVNIGSNQLIFFPIVKSTMILYVIIYTLYFLAGSIRITSLELIKVIVKISVVNSLLSNMSDWDYFNTYLFQIFFGGANYLIANTIGATSSVNNIFGFIDPMLDFYFNANMWWLIFTEFISFWKGTTILAILLIVAILNLIIVLLDVIIKYILAILSICVLISLAPLFIILILFETTRPIFNNWISSLVRYVLEPVFMFIFLLMIQQILMLILPQAIPGATWEHILPLKIYFSLGSYTFNIDIPGCPGLAFYQPNNINIIALMSNTFIIFCISLLTKGFLNYSQALVSAITGTQGLPSTQYSPSSEASKTIGMDKINQSWGIEKSSKEKTRETATEPEENRKENKSTKDDKSPVKQITAGVDKSPVKQITAGDDKSPVKQIKN